MIQVSVPELNLEQCKAIYIESLNRGLIKTQDGSIPADEVILKKDAHDLVEQAVLASKAGNKSENVETLLFIAQSDMKPIMPDLNTSNDQRESSKEDEFDLSEISDEVLDGLIVGLDKYVETPTIKAEREKFLAEKAKRKTNAQTPQSQEESQAAPQGEAEQPSGETSDASIPADSAVGSQIHSETSGGSVSAGDGAKEDQSETEDAGAFARDKITEENGKGNNSSAKSSEEDAELAQLQGQLDFSILKAHGVSLENIEKLSKIQMEYMIANPTGPGIGNKELSSSERANIIPGTFAREKEEEKEKDVDLVPSNTEKSVSMVQEAPVKQVQITKEVLGPEVVEENPSGPISSGITQDREELESQLTGPILRAYGRNRKEVPSIGDNELALMIGNPTAQTVTLDQLTKAKALDHPESDIESVEKEEAGEEAQEESKVNLEGFKEINSDKLKENEDSSLKSGTLLAAEVEEEQESKILVETFDINDIKEIDDSNSDAMKIIMREAMPIPPELSGDGPILPEDVSKISRDELYSLHARFHACESRMNWLVINSEDQLEDIIKLRHHREVIAAEEVPLVVDGKRVTNEYRDSKVEADSEILKYKDEEHPIKKTLKRLKVLRDGYCRDCERLSRQMSKYELEKNNAR